ncbi:hypothetical protein BC1002_4274 [Paraburkholderia atlantica]|uniref:Uncharacterized protein n=1 Tax=Paraburkholderia atlantica TaxID=2654982 RepID=D5WIG7_PARAM|nr:hypothetical protein BC1002_4274 [Paraburkholderia atlantica]
MDASLPRRIGEAVGAAEPSLYPTASECQSGGVNTTTEGKEGSK